jgi:hypothetical protein
MATVSAARDRGQRFGVNWCSDKSRWVMFLRRPQQLNEQEKQEGGREGRGAVRK